MDNELRQLMVPGEEVSYDPVHKAFKGFLTDYDHADLVIFGMPFDGGTFRHVGTNEGPVGIRKGLNYFRNWSAELGLNITDQIRIADIGNIDVYWNEYDRSFANLGRVVSQIVKDGKVPLMLGGDHSATYQAVGSLCKERNEKIGFVCFDNHLDTMSEYHGDRFYCGTPFYNLMKEYSNWIDPHNFVHIGSRGFHNSPNMWQNAAVLGFNIVTAEQVKLRGIQDVVRKAIEVASRGTSSIYLTVDIDAADAVYAPGTQCPRPCGLNSFELCYAVREVAKQRVVGFDIMEVAPRADIADVTIMLAASLLLEFIAGYAYQKFNAPSKR